MVDIKYRNNFHFNITESFYSVIGFYVSSTVSTYISNCTFESSSTTYGIFEVFSSDNVTIDGIYFYNLYPFAERIVKVMYFKNLKLNDMVWTNALTLSESTLPLNSFLPYSGATFQLSNMHVYSTNLIDRPLISISRACNFIASNLTFENLKMSTGGIIIKTGPVNGLQMRNVTFKGITGVTPNEVENYLIYITSIDTKSSNNYLIDNVKIYNSSSNLLSLNVLLNSPLSTKYFNISNILYDSSIIQFYNDLIKFGNMENQIDLNIIFTNITFSNLIFKQGGNMLYFQQQLKNPVSFQNILFSNITGGSITILSANKQRLDLTTKVVFQNLTANLLNGVYYSFINVLTGGVLEIADSSFANIFNAQSGAVVYAGYKNSLTTIKNSVFVNNTSLKGGVFNIEYNSMVVLNS